MQWSSMRELSEIELDANSFPSFVQSESNGLSLAKQWKFVFDVAHTGTHEYMNKCV